MDAPDITSTSLSSGARFTRQRDGARIVVIDGPDRSRDLVVGDKGLVIGSAPNADLVLGDPQVSRRHLEVRNLGSRLAATDLGSKNGSFLGPHRFREIDLAVGATIRLGNTLLKVLPLDEELELEPHEGIRYGGLIGKSKTMRQLFALIDQIAAAPVSVLIEGETGTGKERVAEEIHARSQRSRAPFVIFDCGAVADELAESILFGHVRGAFTGATAARSGILASADGGTVFIDEIGELATELQPTLLRFLDRGMVRPIGATRYETVDARVIAATHRHLSERIAANLFREDLYYRLAVVRIRIPPLRERPDDIPLLVDHFIHAQGAAVEVESQTLDRLCEYHWPGNVRQLANVVAAGIALSTDGKLLVGDLGGGSTSTRDTDDGAATALPYRQAKAEALAAFEREYFGSLMRSHPSITKAANAAEMDRKHLRMLLEKHGLKPGA